MEFLRGESLRAAIKEKHTGDLGNKIRIANQIGRALEYIHARKIVHRDIKPENVHVDTVGKVKLMDFGIAKSEGLSLTRAGFTLGTPYYMAPEQVLGQSVTYLVDVYAFGVLLYELLAGVKPISGDTVEKIFNQILYEPLNIEPLRAVGVTPPLFDLILRCTAKQPAQRPQGFGIVCGELEALIDPQKPSSQQRQTTMTPQTTTRPTQPAMPSQQQQQVPMMRPSQDIEGLPGFVKMLPRPLRTQTGLIALAGLMTLLMIVVLYLVLSFAKII
jgi:serine/threonine-protein kinase